MNITNKERTLFLEMVNNDNTNRSLNVNNFTVNQLIDIWLTIYQEQVKKSTYTCTSGIINRNIRNQLGDFEVNDLTPIIIQQAINHWASLYSYSRYMLIINYLNRMIELGIKLNLIAANPINNVIIPKNKEDIQVGNRIKYYSKKELQIFLDTIEHSKVEHYKKARDYAIFRLLSFSGCRIGEILALNWQDVNLITGELDIHKTLTKARFHYISQTPKTRNSQRIIYLDDTTISYLKEWQKIQLDYLNKHGYQQANFIFTNSKNNFTINQAITERYKIYQKEANLKYIGLHGFRHTHASLLFEAGVDYKDIQERLGHVNLKTTMDIYTHICDKRKQETIKKLVAFTEF